MKIKTKGVIMTLEPLKIGKYTIQYPIIQGGMGVGVSWDQLAGTVSKEGGLGVISSVGTGYYQYPRFMEHSKGERPNTLDCNSANALKEIFINARKICDNKPIATNIMHALTGYKQNVVDACKAGTDIIICGAGLAVDLPSLTKDYPEVALVPIVSSIRATNIIFKKWTRLGKKPDAIIVEGPKSGGHQGFKLEDCDKEEFQLENIILPIIEFGKLHDIPIIAAGGIWDKNDIEYYMLLGCSGVQMGTRFVTTYECDTSDLHKQMLINCTKDDISLKGSPVGLPSRSITTTLHENIKKGTAPKIKCVSNCVKECNHGEGAKKVGYCIADRLSDTIIGKNETGLFFTGSNGFKANEIISVHELMNKLIYGK
jgi:nitronate monooxygenase